MLVPFIFGVLGLFLINSFGLDLKLASWIFALEGGEGWQLRHNPFFEHVLHNGGRHLVTVASVILIISAIASNFVGKLKPYRKSLLMLIISVASTILLVRYGKEVTNVSCPWDVALFGGTKPFMEFPASLNSGLKLGQCYPGGHSSGAFAWVALYYFGLVHKPEWRFKLLLPAVIIGIVFATTQELRGAHFLSHDLTSLWMAWLLATMTYSVMYRPWQASEATESVTIDADVPSLKLTL
ncbi:hypothetical protein HR45_03605 [Shewanella mangrovi]|uniref:Phosphatidic acid phosphatase type 2/haloperoxidase domain-containing protein n=1 Tax=Shewanella mangrovi TaxID=1515746 RepID=A0A094K1J9_9GAMM|nr:hypothetical protein HR45_03605 [Shewanella mangrovi]